MLLTNNVLKCKPGSSLVACNHHQFGSQRVLNGLVYAKHLKSRTSYNMALKVPQIGPRAICKIIATNILSALLII